MRVIALIVTLCIGLGAKAQQFKGYVYGLPDSIALSGATVQIGQKINSQTDQQGLFTANIAPGTYLIKVKYLGYQEMVQELTVPGKTAYHFYLKPDVRFLQEVEVNTGYQRLPKERATGSFQAIANQTLNEQVSTDIMSRLEVLGNGVMVDRRSNTTKLLMRGLSTLDGNKEPLVILDNFPYQGNIGNINPNDIETITLLKDAAATSIWGTRAGNGVIVLTSKKAVKGQQLRVAVNSNISLVNKPDLSVIKQLNTTDFIAVEQFLYDKGYYNSKINAASKPVLSPFVELLLAKKKGTISNADFEAKLAQMKATDLRTEVANTNYQEAVKQQYAILISAAERKMDWKLMAGYDRNISALAAKNSRLSLSGSQTFYLTPNLQLDARVTFTSSLMGNGKADYRDMDNGVGVIYPYLRLKDEQGNPQVVPRTYANSYLNSLSTDVFYDWNYYPLTDYLNNKLTTHTRDLLANLALSYKLFDGLSLQLAYQNERQETTLRNLYGTDSYMVRSIVNMYTQVGSGGAVTRVVPKGEILDHNEAVLRSYNLRGQLNFNRTWGKHELNFLGGGEINQNNTEEIGNRIYGYNDENLSNVVLNLATSYPNYITKSSSFINSGINLTGSTNRFVSMYANMAYYLNKRYIVSASARRDASNLYGLTTNNKWKPLWSVGGAWLVDQEPFFKVNWLKQLKLRASYGFSGNVDLGRTAVTTIFINSISLFTKMPEARFDQFSNPDLRWEKVGTFNLGLDFSLKGNRLSGSMEVYQKKSVDLYGLSPVDFTAVPVTALIRNVASIRARGLDVQLRSQNIDKGLKWQTLLNFNLYRDKTLIYYQPKNEGSLFVSNGNLPKAIVGYPIHSVLSYAWAGLDPANGNPQGYYQGKPSSDYNLLTGSTVKLNDLVYHGPAFPTLFGTLGNTFTYKGLSLSVSLSYKFGYYFRRSSINYSSLFSQGIGHPDYAQRWQQPGDELKTNVPSMVYPAVSRRDQFYNNASFLVEKGDHIRLAYINMVYALNNNWLKRSPFKSIQLQANASNLGILWRANRYGLDPDYRDNAILPSKQFSLGLNCTF